MPSVIVPFMRTVIVAGVIVLRFRRRRVDESKTGRQVSECEGTNSDGQQDGNDGDGSRA